MSAFMGLRGISQAIGTGAFANHQKDGFKAESASQQTDAVSCVSRSHGDGTASARQLLGWSQLVTK